jgi:hypothetical protein
MAGSLDTHAVSEINQITLPLLELTTGSDERFFQVPQLQEAIESGAPIMEPPTENAVLPSATGSEAAESITSTTPTLVASSITTQETPVQLDKSTSSSISSASEPSTSSSRISEGGISVRKRGYMRPQATIFAESAKNRESVMSLGSIAHLQYYFARTGLLDGKGAQMARKNLQIKVPTSDQRSVSLVVPGASTDGLSPVSDVYAASDIGTLSESPLDIVDDAQWDRELAMLPPTVSTYNQRPAYVPPPPDLTMLRRELTQALEEALKGLKDTNKSDPETGASISPSLLYIASNIPVETQGWYELQGLHILDTTTLAIRAAKNYYTAHSKYQRLHSIKSEREIRRELYHVLEILKRMAARNFAGGLRQTEKVGILSWIVGISELIQAEIDAEKQEAEERRSWSWRAGDWEGREREREAAFIRSFVDDPPAVPEWPSPTDPQSTQPSPFLSYFASGVVLVQLHNTLVSASSRPFALINSFHTDTAKPYRRADNLRYWIKAAELRWDIHIAGDVDVLGVATGTEKAEVWSGFDTAILKWCQGVREDLTKEWAEAEARRAKRSAEGATEGASTEGVSATEGEPLVDLITVQHDLPASDSTTDLTTNKTSATEGTLPIGIAS